MYEIVSWPLLITAALCFTTQGCALPAPSWPVVLNYCSGATRKFFSQKSCAGHPGFHGSRALGSFQFFLEHSLATSKNLGVSFNMGQTNVIPINEEASWPLTTYKGTVHPTVTIDLHTCRSQDKCEAPAKNLEDKFRSYVPCAIYKSIIFQSYQ